MIISTHQQNCFAPIALKLNQLSLCEPLQLTNAILILSFVLAGCHSDFPISISQCAAFLALLYDCSPCCYSRDQLLVSNFEIHKHAASMMPSKFHVICRNFSFATKCRNFMPNFFNFQFKITILSSIGPIMFVSI